MAHDVFISYSSKDKTVADAVCATLEGRKIRCWIAPRDVPPGLPYAAALVNAINDCKVFVLVLSKGSNSSGQVLREVEEAVDHGIPIIPLRIEDFEPTEAMRYYIKSLHWLDAMSLPLERHLGKLADSVQALLSVGAGEQPPSVAETVIEAPARKRWPLPTWATALLAFAAVGIVGGGAWFASTRLGSASIDLETTSSTVNATGWSVWRPVSFLFPNPQIWDVAGDNQYTAIDQRDTDVYAWSTESYQGDIMVSLDLRSSVEALDLSWEEMQAQIPSQNSGCVIIYGDGTDHSYGSLVFCVDWDGYFLDEHNRRYDNEFLAYVLHDNPSEEVYSVSVEIIDDVASMSVNGEKVLTSIFDTEEIDRSGRIGLCKYWADGEITFSNIQIKTRNSDK